MNELGTCSAKYVSTLIEVAYIKGAQKSDLYRILGVDGQHLSLPHNRVGSEKVIELLNLAVLLISEEQLGLHIGEFFKPGTFDSLGYSLMCSNTLHDAIELNYQYQALTQQIGRSELYVEGDLAFIEWRPKIDDVELLRPLTEAVMAGYASLGRWLTWEGALPITKMYFAHKAPRDDSHYQRVFKCPIEFDAERTAICFDKEFLKYELQQADTTLVSLLKLQMDQRLAHLNDSDSAQYQLTCFIQSQLQNGIPNIATAAKAMGYSERTLKRRLQQENTNYRSLVEKLRKTSAKAYLKRPDLKLTDVAFHLGYKNQSAFCSAFHSWFGTSPTKFLAHSDSCG